jgi:hypothetical protein
MLCIKPCEYTDHAWRTEFSSAQAHTKIALK